MYRNKASQSCSKCGLLIGYSQCKYHLKMMELKLDTHNSTTCFIRCIGNIKLYTFQRVVTKAPLNLTKKFRTERGQMQEFIYKCLSISTTLDQCGRAIYFPYIRWRANRECKQFYITMETWVAIYNKKLWSRCIK